LDESSSVDPALTISSLDVLFESLSPYLSLYIQNFEVSTFLEVYRQAVFAKAYLILVEKLPSCMPIPYFLMLAQIQLLRPHEICMAPPLVIIPTLVQ